MQLAVKIVGTIFILGVILGALLGFLCMHTKPGSRLQKCASTFGNISLGTAALSMLTMLALVGLSLWL
ncbi:MAG: hypothetical protein Q7S83_00880 [bacterium]|nr:hypothetical protein [bacterium]